VGIRYCVKVVMNPKNDLRDEELNDKRNVTFFRLYVTKWQLTHKGIQAIIFVLFREKQEGDYYGHEQISFRFALRGKLNVAGTPP
jgi:hypothetical protein